MFHAKNHKVLLVFDPWEFLGPKRRKLLDESWSGLFRENILKILPVGKLKPSFTRGFGRPSKEIYSAVGAMVLQQMHNLSDEETREQIAFYQQWHYALDITSESDKSKYFCEKTLYSIRTAMIEHRLDSCIFSDSSDTMAKVFGVDTQKQRIDSVHIKSNMLRLGRIRIFSTTIHKFLVNLKRHYSKHQFLQVSSEIVERYLTDKALGCFSRVKPTESNKTLDQVSSDLLSLVEQFKGDEKICSLHSYKLLERVLRDQCEVVEATDEFKDVYRYRSGSEATMSEFDRRTGVKRLRVRGMGSVPFCAVLKAVGLNIFRAAAVKRVRTRLQETISAVNSAQKVLGFVFKEQFMKLGATIFGFSVKHPQFCDSAYKNAA